MLSAVYAVAILFLWNGMFTGIYRHHRLSKRRHCPLVYMVLILHVWNATFGAGCVNSPRLMSSSNRSTLHYHEREAPCSSYIGNLHWKDVVSTFVLCRM